MVRKKPAATSEVVDEEPMATEEMEKEVAEEEVVHSAAKRLGGGGNKMERVKQRCGWCGLCQAMLRNLVGHCSRRPRCKGHPGTRRLSEEEMAQMLAELNAEAEDPQAGKLRRVEAAKARHAEIWRAPESLETPREGSEAVTSLQHLW